MFNYSKDGVVVSTVLGARTINKEGKYPVKIKGYYLGLRFVVATRNRHSTLAIMHLHNKQKHGQSWPGLPGPSGRRRLPR